MDKEKYFNLFQAFEAAPIAGFLELLFKGVAVEGRKKLILEDVAYHRHSADIVALDAWMYLTPVESNQWIWARVEMDVSTGAIEERFFTKGNYHRQAFGSLEDCIEYYKQKD